MLLVAMKAQIQGWHHANAIGIQQMHNINKNYFVTNYKYGWSHLSLSSK